MIHLLEITSEIAPPELKKLSRKLSMTGGYELALKPGQTSSQLERIVEVYKEELPESERGKYVFRTSNAYQILNLVFQEKEASEGLKSEIKTILGL